MKINNDFARVVFVIPSVFLLLIICSFKLYDEKEEPQKLDFIQSKDSIADELGQILINEFELWYPVSVDLEYGGFYSDLNYKWELQGRQNKFIVTQARHVWSNANAATYYPDKSPYLKVAKHGLDFLKNVMWDKEYGGFYDLVTRKGEVVVEQGKIIKRAYGNSFAIYGLAAYYKVSGDNSALELAKSTFNWLEKHSYDPKYGGYYQFLSREGNPFKEGFGIVAPKDQNSSIHLLECFTELYKVWPDKILKSRLESLMKIIRDTIVTEKGYMNLFFKKDWTPISYRDSSEAARRKNIEFDHVSFGHDIETAYLLLEASEALGIENDSITRRIAKKMVDHTIVNGWDNQNCGIFDGGYYLVGKSKPEIVLKTKEWWSQAESMNSLLIMAKLYPDDQIGYFQKFLQQWNYIKVYLLDFENGGWYRDGLDTAPYAKKLAKASTWKCNYHTSRSLINCLRNLKKM